MKARETSVDDLLQGKKHFQVPLYQRTYAWTMHQWRPLWEAICEQAEALNDGAVGPGHFLGSVVLAPGPGTPALPSWIVVDGQQRLTTLSLALCAIRDHISDDDRELAAEIHSHYLTNSKQEGNLRLKLLPTQADRAAYVACINATPHAGGGGNIGEAYRFFQRMLVEADDPEDPHDIERIQQAMTMRLDVVEIPADHGDNVHRIFECLNNTGMSLSQADLLRNYLFMLLPSRGEDVYQRLWLPMQERLGSERLELLAWLDLVLRGNERLRRDEVYRDQQRRLQELNGDEAAIEAEVAELARRSAHLQVILHPDHEPDARLRAALRRLDAWGAGTTYPVLMWLFDRRERCGATNEQVLEAMSYIESFLVRRMLCGRGTHNLNRIFSAAPGELESDISVADAVRRYLSQERRYWPDDEELRTAIRERNFYWSGRATQRAFVLRRLEESFAHKEPIDWQQAKLSVEHIMPQRPGAEWLAELAGEVEGGETAEELHHRLVHRVGNLTLTGYNPELSNKVFVAKREWLANSGLAMNHAVAECTRWGKAEILQRGDELASRAIGIWPGPLARRRAAPEEDPKWLLLRETLAAIPAGNWTTYSDLAEVIGSHPVAIGGYIADHAVPNGWRVLLSNGHVSAGFRWYEAGRNDDPVAVLRAEGVRFDERCAADPSQRLPGPELARLAGLAVEEPVLI